MPSFEWTSATFVVRTCGALANATGCVAAEGGKWRTTGPDLDGDALDVVVAVVDGVVVVTVF